ncbi:MAG: AIR synthase-related protein, partial [Pseudomonadota bacterium]|nr:AIR synthase-related protein [Pseudomonadota bacterium]
DKTFLITIADRTVGGQIVRDQMVGPWQVPVADVGVMTSGFRAHTGSAMAMGERTPIAVVNGPASGRMAIAEALTNIAGAAIDRVERVKLSANWMCACGEDGEDAQLFDTVRAVGLEFCPEVGVAIPVGKDSLSMRTVWKDGDGSNHTVVAPLSLVVSAFAGVTDVNRTLTPELKRAGSELLLVDLGRCADRLGGSALAQVYDQLGSDVPDVAALDVRNLFAAVQQLNQEGLLLAYHDRSDGGLFVTVVEMAFAGSRGVHIDLGDVGSEGNGALAALFSEEIGVVIEVDPAHRARVFQILTDHSLADCSQIIGETVDEPELQIVAGGDNLYRRSLQYLHRAWSELSHRMQTLRDHPETVAQEYEGIGDPGDPGLSAHAPFEWAAAAVASDSSPRVA